MVKVEALRSSLLHGRSVPKILWFLLSKHPDANSALRNNSELTCYTVLHSGHCCDFRQLIQLENCHNVFNIIKMDLQLSTYQFDNKCNSL
jgi:hypothetical protein